MLSEATSVSEASDVSEATSVSDASDLSEATSVCEATSLSEATSVCDATSVSDSETNYYDILSEEIDKISDNIYNIHNSIEIAINKTQGIINNLTNEHIMCGEKTLLELINEAEEISTKNILENDSGSVIFIEKLIEKISIFCKN